MSAWKKQAVPLVFLEIGMTAILKNNGHHPAVRRIHARVERWLGECWEPLRAKSGRIDDESAVKQTVRAATEIQSRLVKTWGAAGLTRPVEMPCAMLTVAEDTLASMPVRKKDGRRKAWGYLIRALWDLCQVVDPEFTDRAGQDRGVKIAEIVMEVAA